MRLLSPALIGIALLLSGGSALGDTVVVSASVLGSARDSDGDGIFESLSFTTAIVLQRENPIDRGLWEFDLSELPLGTILGISLKLEVASTTLDRTNYDVYGHVGNGTIETADATAGSLLAADLDGNVISQTVPVFVDVTGFILDPSVQAAGFAGFMARYPIEIGPTLQKQLVPPSLIVEFVPSPECDDGIDNDLDGFTDFPDDPGCPDALQDFEDPECDDGIDNDSDTFTDFPADPGCFVPAQDNESPACDDGIDNDGDGGCDLPASTCTDGSTPGDPKCFAAWDDSEDSCGIGFELAFLLPPLIWLRRQRRRRIH